MSARLRQLMYRVLFHKNAYYKGTPVISDAQFDKLEDELRDKSPDNIVLHVVGDPEFCLGDPEYEDIQDILREIYKITSDS